MSQQKGQAMLEMVVVTSSILLLIWGLVWLQRWQQVKVQTQHHAALSAFRFSQSYELGQVDAQLPSYIEGLYSGISHQQNSQRLSLGEMAHGAFFIEQAQKEGVLGPSDRWRFESQSVQSNAPKTAIWSTNAFAFLPSMAVKSQTSIWVGAGHAQSDKNMTQRLTASTSLWGHAQKTSQVTIGALSPFLQAVDLGWGRKAPTIDWLEPWQESVPVLHLP